MASETVRIETPASRRARPTAHEPEPLHVRVRQHGRRLRRERLCAQRTASRTRGPRAHHHQPPHGTRAAALTHVPERTTLPAANSGAPLGVYRAAIGVGEGPLALNAGARGVRLRALHVPALPNAGETERSRDRC